MRWNAPPLTFDDRRLVRPDLGSSEAGRVDTQAECPSPPIV